MKSIYEEAGGTYTRQGDYELPNLKVPPEKEIEIGVWGQRYRRYLKQHHRIRYYNLLPLINACMDMECCHAIFDSSSINFFSEIILGK